MKNRKISLMLLFSFALTLTGCNKEENIQNQNQVVVTETPEEIDETGFGITLEEQRMCAEYAAGVLMKYNAGSNMRVLEGMKLQNMEAKEQAQKAQEEKREQLAAEYQANKKESSEEKSNKDNSLGNSSSDSAAAISYISDMSVATGTDAFSSSSSATPQSCLGPSEQLAPIASAPIPSSIATIAAGVAPVISLPSSP